MRFYNVTHVLKIKKGQQTNKRFIVQNKTKNSDVK